MTNLPSASVAEAPVVIAPDGSIVRILCTGSRGSMASFALPPGGIARAVAHRSVEEIWYVLSGRGQMWRRLGAEEDVLHLEAGWSLTIPAGTNFQFRCLGAEPLVAVAVTMPPWPGAQEAYDVPGPWAPTV
jgi:mannose-6-phosphate isomerase-like protein (cupin superfamily)